MSLLASALAFALSFFKSTSIVTNLIKDAVLFVIVFILALILKQWLGSLNNFTFAAVVSGLALLLDIFHRLSSSPKVNATLARTAAIK